MLSIPIKIPGFFSFFKKKRRDRNLENILEDLRAHPDDPYLRVQLGEAYFKRKEIEKGIETLETLAKQHLDAGLTLNAITLYKEILRFSPTLMRLNERLADLYQKIGLKKEAVGHLLILIQHHQNRKEKDKVLFFAEKLLALDPTDFKIRLKKAEIDYQQGLEKQALAEYERLGDELREAESANLSMLIEVLEKMLFRRPKDLHLLKEICELHLKMQDAERCIKAIEKYKLTQHTEFRDLYEEAKRLSENQSASV